MNDSELEFHRGAVRPIRCYLEGWQLIKDDFWLFLGISFLGMLIGHAVPLQILLGPMWCGVEICLLRRMRGQRVSFNHLFDGFNFFGPSLVGSLFVTIPTFILVLCAATAYMVLMVGVVLPQAPQGGGPADASFFLSFFGVVFGYIVALTLIPFVLTAPFVFMYALIVEHGLSGPQAFLMSLRAVLGNPLRVAALLLINMLLTYAGMALFCVGIYLVMPITFAAYAVAYRQVFPREEPREVVPVDEPEAFDAPREERPSSTGIQAEASRDVTPETGITPGPPE